MSPLAAFLLANMVPIFFLYGLAFFSMGLALLLESRRTSELPIARALSLLGGFGLLHGLNEWAEMAQILAGPTAGWVYSLPAEACRLALLVLSFLFLFACGARLTLSEGRWPWDILSLTAGLVLLWLLAIQAVRLIMQPSESELLIAADVLSRYLVAVPGAILTAWGLSLQRRTFRAKGMPAFGRDLFWAAGAFLLYGALGQVFTKPSVIFPSTVFNSGLFLSLFGIPVQLFRTIMAGVISATVIHALRAFELENRQQLALANEARLTAQRQALEEQRKRQEETSQLNQELQTAARELTVLYDLSRILASTLELDTLLKEAVLRIVTTLDYVSAASIWLYDEASGDLNLMACQGCSQTAEGVRLATEAKPFDRARGIVGAAMKTRCAMGLYPSGAIAPIIGEGPTEVGPDGQRREIRPRVVGVPLVWKDQTRGGLLLEVSPDQAGFSSDDLPLIGAMSVPLSIAVENAILYGEAKTREAMRAQFLHRVVSAQEAERQRVARELHDETGQALTALALGLKGTAETLKVNPALAGRQLDELRAETSQALDALRRLVLDLRPSQLDDLGLSAALRWYVEDLAERMPVKAAMEVSGTPRRLTPEVESVLFRIAQEALTNVAKHACANSVKISLDFGASDVLLTVVDDGIGFTPEAVLKPQARRKSWGLLGMQERADLVGGRCLIEARPRHGTTVSVRVPLGEGALRHEKDQAAAG